jgi:glutamine synthetase
MLTIAVAALAIAHTSGVRPSSIARPSGVRPSSRARVATRMSDSSLYEQRTGKASMDQSVLASYMALPMPEDTLQAEYIFIDANLKTRGKCRTLSNKQAASVEVMPRWTYDGSSTGQAPGEDSEVIMVPRAAFKDPFRPNGKNLIVLCDTYDAKGNALPTNARAAAAKAFEADKGEIPWFGIEQEYTIFNIDKATPLGWPRGGYPLPQGPYYCGAGTFGPPPAPRLRPAPRRPPQPSQKAPRRPCTCVRPSRWQRRFLVRARPPPRALAAIANVLALPFISTRRAAAGADRRFGRAISEAHYAACRYAGLMIAGTNAEVMPGQWEYQIGPAVGIAAADQLWVSRYILDRVAEDFNVYVTLEPKPIKTGEWNGAGAHINFSTEKMRAPGGMKEIVAACERLGKKHAEHIAIYGEGNSDRLTGKYETCDINTFRYGVADRGASIRIPRDTEKEGCGYLEDRRPASNVEPYAATAKIFSTSIGK